jgi:hypothetical protein
MFCREMALLTPRYGTLQSLPVLKGLTSEITGGEGSEIVSIDIILLYEYEPLRGYFPNFFRPTKKLF